jgi:predicted dehydrogenase
LFLEFADTRKVDSVTGYVENLTKNERVGLDSVDVLIRAGQVRGSIRISPDTRPDGLRLVLRGTLGTLETDLYNPYLRVTRALNSGLRAPLEQIRSGFSLMRSGFGNIRNKVRQHTPYHGMPRMLDAIYRSIQEGGPSPIDADDILATAELIDQILSLRHRQ